MQQFPSDHKKAVQLLLEHVHFVSESDMVSELRELNNQLLVDLEERGVPANHVIYVSFHEAGSSSAAVLNLVRDACGLELKRCSFVDASNARGLHETTSRLGKGAIVYVDDFIGTGNQFCTTHEFVSQHVVGTFSEYLLVHAICEEGVSRVARATSVDPVAVRIHGRAERPLHEFSYALPGQMREKLRAYCLGMNRQFGLGYKSLATSIVYYRNSPNTVPLVLRGSRGQTPLRGLVPRTTDLGPT
jgi:hypothetical protein